MISVLLPTKNAATTIQACIEGILSQTVAPSLEIIAIDSGSTDGTLELLRHYPVRVHAIAPKDFNHGGTRNFATTLARGEFVVFTVQDARPADAHWIDRMWRHFDDPAVAGVCGQQIVPHEADKNPLQWFRPHEEPVPRKIRFAASTEFEALSPPDRVALCGWDNVTAMYRRSVLLDLPFQHVGFSEDQIWAKDALISRHALVYDYSARVYHYHDESAAFRFRREFTILYHRYEHFGAVRAPMWLLPELARCAYRAARRKYCPSRRARWLAYNTALIVATWAAGWLFWLAVKGGEAGAVRRLHARLCAAPPQPFRAT